MTPEQWRRAIDGEDCPAHDVGLYAMLFAQDRLTGASQASPAEAELDCAERNPDAGFDGGICALAILPLREAVWRGKLWQERLEDWKSALVAMVLEGRKQANEP